MKASAYQQNVLEFISTGKGHGFVSAVAGSGKTTTLKMICEQIAGKGTAAFVAFNKHIRDELAARLPQFVTVATLHQIGLRTTAYGLGKRVNVDSADKLVKEAVDMFISTKVNWAYARKAAEDEIKEIEAWKPELIKLVRFAKSSLVDEHSAVAVGAMMDRFDLDLPMDIAMEFLPGMLARSIEVARKTGVINFDDMIWLPVRLNMRPQTFKWVMVDEAQDLTPAQRELTMKMIAPGGRLIYVGDPRQAIYAFAGADSKSTEEIIKANQAKVMPLSVCYRCPKSHVALAKEIVPEIESAPNAPEGKVEHIKEEDIATLAQIGDIVLCRTTAPLISTAFAMIALRKPAKVKGRDLGAGLVKMMDKIRRKAKIKDIADFGSAAEQYMTDVRANMSGDDVDMKMQRIQDQVASLNCIIEATFPADFKALAAEIEGIFSDDNGGICLSTVHRAKGLEADRVFVMRTDIMPHPMAKTEDAKLQESNLKYIAMTRSKNELYLSVTPDGKDKKDAKKKK